MRIAAVTVTRLSVPLASPYRTSLELRQRGDRSDPPLEQVLVEVESDDGLVGYGESAPDPAFPRGVDPSVVAATIEDELGPLLAGHDAGDVAAVVRMLEQAVPDAPLAIAPVDIALWDLAGKAQGCPVFSLLGGPAREFVAVHRSIGIKPVEEVAADARAAIESGCFDFKLKVGGPDFDVELAAVAAVRELAGARGRITIDANGAWSAEEAVRRIQALDKHRLALVEQPVPGDDLVGMASVRRATGVPILADESCFSAADVAEIARVGAADAVNVKLMKCGGLCKARAMADAAQVSGLDCFVGGMSQETEIGASAGVQFALSHRAVRYSSGVMTVATERAVGSVPWEVRDGRAYPRAGIAGLGLELDPRAVARYRV
jgi:L-alanine-DL-glutamate epimerase-like enolase superfamily enzyme